MGRTLLLRVTAEQQEPTSSRTSSLTTQHRSFSLSTASIASHVSPPQHIPATAHHLLFSLDRIPFGRVYALGFGPLSSPAIGYQSPSLRALMGWRGILGYEYGVVLAPLGPDISGPQLVSAVANAGGLGLLRAPDWEAPEYLRDLIRQTRSLTQKPFGVGVVLAFPHEANIKAILEEKVDVLQVYWGECSKELVDRAHSAGVKIIPQVGSAEEVKRVIDAGVDALIVQGREAGGHVIGQESLISLLPRVVDIVGDREIPVIAAGGIADGRGYVAALALGAKGVCLGTRFVATEESNAHPTYKQKLVEYDKTEYTTIFGRARWPGAPHRVLQTPLYKEWKSIPDDEDETSHPVIGRSTIHGMDKEMRRLAGTVPNASAKGEIESMVMYAGEGVGLITEILPAQQVVMRLVEEARTLIHKKLQLS